MPLSTAVRQTRPIHIRLTKEYLAVFVRLDKLRNDLYMPYYWVSWLKYWDAQYPKRRKLLVVYSRDIPASLSYAKKCFLAMHGAAISQDWTEDLFPSHLKVRETEN